MFSIVFSPSIYNPGDSVKITFASFKVALTNLNKSTTFDKWEGKVKLFCYVNKKWISLVNDTNTFLNKTFSGKKNNTLDSSTNCSLLLTVPQSRSLTIAAVVRGLGMFGANGHDLPISMAGGPMLSVSIKGIEVEKLK